MVGVVTKSCLKFLASLDGRFPIASCISIYVFEIKYRYGFNSNSRIRISKKDRLNGILGSLRKMLLDYIFVHNS